MPRREPFPFPVGFRALRYRYSPTRIILSRSLKRGVFGGNRGWLAAFIVLRGAIAVRRAIARQEQTVTVDLLRPGQRMFVRAIPVRSAKERKQLLRGG